MNRSSLHVHLLASVAVLLLLLSFDAAGLDLPLARLAGTPTGFPLRDHWLLSRVLHDGARLLAWGAALALCLGVWWPFGVLRRLSWRERVQLATSTLASVLLVSSLKSFSTTSCPWDMAEFGRLAVHLPHFPWPSGPDGGSGHCFPAGHASAGFAFVGGWFVFRHHDRRIARLWLAGALAAGLLLGLAQQLRGAHFMSHTLYSGWLCWCVGFACELLWRRPILREEAADGTPA